MDAKENLDKDKIQLLEIMQKTEKQYQQQDSNQPTTETLDRYGVIIWSL